MRYGFDSTASEAASAVMPLAETSDERFDAMLLLDALEGRR